MTASPYLRGLSTGALRLLERAGEVVEHADGVQLPPDRLYLLLDGEVAASTSPDTAGVREVVGHERRGAMFGSVAITGELEQLIYRAVGQVRVRQWGQAVLLDLFRAEPDLATQLGVRLSLRRRCNELVLLLRNTQLFARAGQSLVRWVVGRSTLAWFDASAEICREGDVGDAMFLIVTGEVGITREAGDGRVQQMARLRRGDFFGEIALLEGGARTATAVAVTACEVLSISRSDFAALYKRSVSFRHGVRVAAQMRLSSDTAPRPEPEAVWLVNSTRLPGDCLAVLVGEALAETVGALSGPVGLTKPSDLQVVLDAARRAGAHYALCQCDETAPPAVARAMAERAGTIVHFSNGPDAAFPYPASAPRSVLHVLVSDAAAVPRRGGILLPDLPARLRAVALADLPLRARDRLLRLARAISRRTVAVALGGGAAWGYAHVALLRALERERIPVDQIVGVSMGSIVGAFYASQGLDGLDRLMAARLELSAAAVASIASISALDLFLRRHVSTARIEDLRVPFAAVAVDARTSRERAFRHGSLIDAVRASCSLPGVFGRPVLGGERYLDGCVRNNVPASFCTESDADLVIACDVVPSPAVSRDVPHDGGIRRLVLQLSGVERLTDTVRSLYWLASDSGRRQAALADAVFAPQLPEFFPWDFHRAGAIEAKAQEQIEEWLPAVVARYRELGAVDG